MRFSQLFLQSVVRHGIDKCFGIVGAEAEFLDYSYGGGPDFYLTRHEFAAGVMADVAGRLLGRPHMCWSTFGPGVTNMSTGACSAMLDRSPLLLASPQIPRGDVCYNRTHQCIDNLKVMQPLTKASAQLERPDALCAVLSELLQTAVDGVPGPAYLSLPLDLLAQEVPASMASAALGNATPPNRMTPPSPSPVDLSRARSMIRRARHPIILVGNQVIREAAGPALTAFAEKGAIPVACTLAAKGVLPDDHPLFLAALNKYIDLIYGRDVIADIFEETDLVILVGYDFGEDVKPSLWQRKLPLLLLNSFYVEGPASFEPDGTCVGSLQETLEYLSFNLDESPGLVGRQRLVKPLLDQRRTPHSTNCTDVAKVVAAISHCLGSTGVFCSDIGLHKQYAGVLSRTYRPNRFICSNVCGTFGFGLPAALAAKLCLPTERVAVLCGDGGFHSTSHDLETAARYNLPVVIIVLNDSSLGLIEYYHNKHDEAGNSVGMTGFGDVDFCLLAQANGVAATRVSDNDDLVPMLEAAFDSGRPHLLEVRTTYDVTRGARNRARIAAGPLIAA